MISEHEEWRGEEEKEREEFTGTQEVQESAVACRRHNDTYISERFFLTSHTNVYPHPNDSFSTCRL